MWKHFKVVIRMYRTAVAVTLEVYLSMTKIEV
jgi:hypothetical protein